MKFGSRTMKLRQFGWALGLVLALLLPAQLISAPLPGSSVPVQAESRIETVEGTVEFSSEKEGTWKPAKALQRLQVGDRLRTGKNSRATIRLSDLSVLRINEQTSLQLLPPPTSEKKPLLDVKNGSIYFFSREKPDTIKFQTPLATAAIRGTEFHVQVDSLGETAIDLIDGAIFVSNAQGELDLLSGQRAQISAGKAPIKTPMLEAVNIIQWCLYYPAIIDPRELAFSADEAALLAPSLAAYNQGDLSQAFDRLPESLPASEAAIIYHAALVLGRGQAGQAASELGKLRAPSPLAAALNKLVSAVQYNTLPQGNPPGLASEWLAESFYAQSQHRLQAALKAAHGAVAKSPEFGFGWIRVAELEFSFGHVPQAMAALEKGLALAPRHAAALALKGFLLSAQNQTREAITWFDRAIETDGGLGNAWLGRGLCRIRLGDTGTGVEDLQVAATLEPNRSILRSYLGKAFNHAGYDQLADKDLRLAKKLDPNDPTAWLYSALINAQRNQINDAIRDLEQSQRLNDNQRLFRSKLLLDQDRAVRSANLASVYRDAAMTELSVREASRAVANDYANHSAHYFLADSFESVRDPKGINNRYETAQLSELLIANLLAPIGAGALSRNVSQNDYTRLFDGDHVGFVSSTEYFSSGEWNQYAAQYGNVGNTAWSVDAFYRTDGGQRPNNDQEQRNLSLTVKQQLTRADSVYVYANMFEARGGDVNQYYDPAQASPGLRVKESQRPNLFAGYHHEWNPNSHTLFLFGRLQDTLAYGDTAPKIVFLKYTGATITSVSTPPLFNLNYRSEFEAYSAELQQIWQLSRHTLIAGARYQGGESHTASELDRALTGTVTSQNISADLNRISAYAYDQWQILDPLRLTAGLSYDRLTYPKDVDTSPITSGETTIDRVSPKAGIYFTPWTNGTLRAAYTRSLGGVYYDTSIRLEPTQIGGFNQALRSLAPESSVGSVPGTRFETFGLGFDQSFKTSTYFSIEAEMLKSKGDRMVGALTNSTFFPIPDSPSSTPQTLAFTEKSLTFTANQLLGREWALGARYKISHASLDGVFTDVPGSAVGVSTLNQNEDATLQQLNLTLAYNHSSGFFGLWQTTWSSQSNRGYTPAEPGDDFWQHDIYFGYRFPRRRAEIRAGLLNITGQDYRLNPLNLYNELPRERTFTVSLKLNF